MPEMKVGLWGGACVTPAPTGTAWRWWGMDAGPGGALDVSAPTLQPPERIHPYNSQDRLSAPPHHHIPFKSPTPFII